MTSLTETLPLLDEAVPALPGKVEAVARAGDDFHQAAAQALAAFRDRRGQADALAAQVREALQAVRDQTAEHQQVLQDATGALEPAAAAEARGVEEEAKGLREAGTQAATAFGELEAGLVQAGDRTEAAHHDAREALSALDARTEASGDELAAATAIMAGAVGQVQEAIEQGQQTVSQAVTSLKDAMLRLLSDAQARLGHTYERLEGIRSGQEKAVSDATTALDGERTRLQQEIELRLEADVQRVLEPELEACALSLGALGPEVLQLQDDVAAERTDLAEGLAAVANRIAPLQAGAGQVRQAALQVGIPWP